MVIGKFGRWVGIGVKILMEDSRLTGHHQFAVPQRAAQIRRFSKGNLLAGKKNVGYREEDINSLPHQFPRLAHLGKIRHRVGRKIPQPDSLADLLRGLNLFRPKLELRVIALVSEARRF